ncbi:NOP9 protein, partial [Atlantisia rogersi]|nr:NOP9 protein [Atlantisia rogersi]
QNQPLPPLKPPSPALLTPASASLCLQGALEALRLSQSAASSRLPEALIGHLVPHGDEGALVRGLEDPERSRLLEAAMTAAGANQLRALYHHHLKGRLQHLANHRLANHGLQRFLDHAPTDLLTEALEELGPNLGEALTSRHPGVLVAVAAAARRHPALQRDAMRHLLQVRPRPLSPSHAP